MSKINISQLRQFLESEIYSMHTVFPLPEKVAYFKDLLLMLEYKSALLTDGLIDRDDLIFGRFDFTDFDYFCVRLGIKEQHSTPVKGKLFQSKNTIDDYFKELKNDYEYENEEIMYEVYGHPKRKLKSITRI